MKQFDLMKHTSAKTRHDVKENMLIVGLLTKEERYDEVIRYVQEVMEKLEGEQYVGTDNLIIDSILNIKIQEAKKHGIEVSAKAVILPEMPLNIAHIAFILNEVMNRAMEDCRGWR